MRCPKCGYISFDHLEVCVKCKKNIKAVSDTLHGTVFQVQAPSFLQLQPRQAEDETADDVLVAQSDEYVDDDLDILIEEPQDKDKEIEFGGDEQPELKLEADKKTAEGEEEEDREIEIDFSQFEDDPDEGPALAEEPTENAREEKSFSLEMPEALADISDLAPPARMAEADSEPSPVARKSTADVDDELDFNLGLDDLDLPPAPDSPAETELSLDELDFSDTLAQSPPKPTGKTTADMDEELNFELDLGGLSIHKDQ